MLLVTSLEVWHQLYVFVWCVRVYMYVFACTWRPENSPQCHCPDTVHFDFVVVVWFLTGLELHKQIQLVNQ